MQDQLASLEDEIQLPNHGFIGQRVEFAIECGVFNTGTVIAENVDTGSIIVRDDTGQEWKGYEHQVMLLNTLNDETG